jgi:pyruvate dehydrogenase E1 component
VERSRWLLGDDLLGDDRPRKFCPTTIDYRPTTSFPPSKILPIAYDEKSHSYRGGRVAETQQTNGIEVLETREWLDSLDYVLSQGGPERAGRLLQQLALHARREAGVNLPFSATTPYQNTIPSRQQPPFPGSQEMERRIKSLVRWNAMAMVVRANKIQEGIGGHISTFASAATLYEVAFNHFFHASTESGDRDVVYFQGHAAPGIYARAYLEGRIPKEKLENFRRELKPGGGLSSYPHPWLMPDFWEFPTVSMGLGPIQAIYHARFIKYLENRGLKTSTGARSGPSSATAKWTNRSPWARLRWLRASGSTT